MDKVAKYYICLASDTIYYLVTFTLCQIENHLNLFYANCHPWKWN